MLTQKEIFEHITNRILETMKKGIIPWRRPWTGVSAGDGGAISYVTREPYSLLNQMLLGEPGEYLTFNRARELGGNVKKGEKARMIVIYKNRRITETDPKTGEETVRIIPFLKYEWVFHLNQTEGIPTKIVPGEPTPTASPDERAEEIIRGYLTSDNHPSFQNDQPSNRAYYSPSSDKVVVPMLSQYPIGKTSEYYSTVFHELGHSTGREGRLSRTFGFSMSDPKYAYEELVAEITSAILCNKAGVDTDDSALNNAAYIQGWMRELKNDPKMFASSASKADVAAKYILGIPIEYKENDEKDAERKEHKPRPERTSRRTAHTKGRRTKTRAATTAS